MKRKKEYHQCPVCGFDYPLHQMTDGYICGHVCHHCEAYHGFTPETHGIIDDYFNFETANEVMDLVFERENRMTTNFFVFPRHVLFPQLHDRLSKLKYEIGWIEGWNQLVTEGYKPILMYEPTADGTEAVVRRLYSQRDTERENDRIDLFIQAVERRHGIDLEIYYLEDDE